MDHVHTILLGEDLEKQIEATKMILLKGFPEGCIAICWECNSVLEFSVEEAAKHISEKTWPRCCKGVRMEMSEPGSAPPF